MKSKYMGGDARPAIADCGILSASQLAIIKCTATDLLQQLAQKRLTSVEVTEAFCASAAIAHQILNCLVEFFPDEAINHAKELDGQLSNSNTLAGPLHGLPMAVKDIHDVKGKVTTMAFTAWLDKPPAEADSSTVKIMRDAGAVFFARTTMPQTGMALETTSPLWGRTLNPFNPRTFGAGGSSGGDGALIAMRGSPASGLSTDIGGSIRAPAAFNGLYAMRPTAERVPKTGLSSPSRGNVSIKVSVGPICHSIADLKLFTRLLLTHPTLPNEPTAPFPFWNDDRSSRAGAKLRVGLITTDGVVDPHPPVQRALQQVRSSLQASGHTVVDLQPPFDCWKAALTTWALYFQTGAAEARALLESEGEEPIPPFQYYMKAFDIKPLTVPELFRENAAQAGYKAAFQQAWDSTEGPIDCIICPSAPLAGTPHDFPLWWGYTSLWNLLDYPSVIMPLKDFTINALEDAKVEGYSPRANPFDEANWEICAY